MTAIIKGIEGKLFDQFDFGDDRVGKVDALKLALIESRAVIAGSAIMQSVRGETWGDSDIDIWLPTNSEDLPIDNVCKATGILKCLPNHYDIPNIIKMCPRNRNRAYMPIEQYERLSNYVTHIMTINHKRFLKKAIQIIFVKTTIEEVIASFDIIASQIWYNGKDFYQILPEQFDARVQPPIPMSEIIDDENLQGTDAELPITQLKEKIIKMSTIALELQSPFEWVRTIIRIEKYMTRFKIDKIDNGEKVKIVESIIDKIDKQHVVQPVTRYSLQSMRFYLQNFKTAWKTNESCLKQGITVRWNDNKLEFTIKGDADTDANISRLTTEPPTLTDTDTDTETEIETVTANGNKWDGDKYVINNENENENALKPTTNVDITHKKTCFDFCAYDDEDIENYIEEDTDDNIVIFDASGDQPICYSRQRLVELMNTANAVFYPCESEFPPTAIRDKTLVRIQLTYNVVVPISDVVDAIDNTASKIFRIYKTNTTFDRTKSANVEFNVHEAAMVSGDHCQEGTNKDLHRLLDPKVFQTLTRSGGGKKMFTYNGLKYKLFKGKRGGKYIFVGEKKIYISEKDDLMNQIQSVRSRKANNIQAKKKANKKAIKYNNST